MARRPLALIEPENVFDNFFGNMPARSFSGLQTPEAELDMYEEDENIVINVKAPGFNENNVDINIEDNVLTVTGNKTYEDSDEEEDRRYYYKEMRDESFTRSVSLPMQVKPEETKAWFSQGVLHITLPKSEKSRSHKVSIEPEK